MDEFTIKLSYAILIVVMNVIRIYYLLRYRRFHERESEMSPVREQRLTQMMTLAMSVPGMLWLFTSLLSFGGFPLPDVARIAGFVVGAYGMLYFYRIHKTLGDNWSPVLETRREHNLITDGVYRYVRHPMYSAMILWIISFTLITANWFYAAILCTATTVLFLLRIPDEEKLMLKRFGNRYKDYMQRTKRLIPFIY